MRYRSAAIAEFMRALRTLKALQAEQAVAELPVAAPVLVPPQRRRSAARAPVQVAWNRTNPSATPHRLEYAPHEGPVPGRTLHEPAAPWVPNEPKAERPARLNQAQIPAQPPLVSRPQRSMSDERQVPAASCRANSSAAVRTNLGTR
jgi:hypothetical protein